MSTTNDLTNETIAVVLAGGKGTRLGALTQHICKPALPFGAAYRNIDFSLSNCVNSAIHRIGVAIEHKPEALVRHLDEVWRPVVKGREQFIAAWPSEERAPIRGYRGTADAVFCNLEAIEKLGSRRVLVLAGDHVYRMDYRPLLEHHCRRRADVTVGSVEVRAEEAQQFGILSTDQAGRIDRFVEKPKTLEGLRDGASRLPASMGIYVFETDFLAHVLRRDAASNSSGHDFGRDILPGVLRTARAFAYRFRSTPRGDEPAYWRDVGTPAAYWEAHMDLLGPNPRFRLDDPGWPVASTVEPPIRAVRATRPCGGHVADCLIAGDCEVRGMVHRSVLFSGATVSDCAAVADSIVLPGATIGKHCRLRGVVVESGCRIPDGIVIESTCRDGSAKGEGHPAVLTAEQMSGGVSYAQA